MLKRFYSKRSGFTLVEIIVAFAVFAIMASMIAQILELAIRARNSNTLYAQELARQEKLLTVIDKDRDYYNETDKTGEYVLTIDSKSYKLDYQVKATDPTAVNQAEGINYFLSPVDYQYDNSGNPTGSGAGTGTGTGSSGAGGMTQASRMDTRITGTAGIGNITVSKVVKDTYNYPDDSSFKLPQGHTRYLIEVSASSVNEKGVKTLQKEDVPYSQYRLLFYSNKKDAAQSAIPYKDSDGTEYTRVVYQKANIVKVGFINELISEVQNTGLSSSNTSSGKITSDANKFTVEQKGPNCVRIGSPLIAGKSVRFDSKPTKFYVEFVGDPELTVKSFGHNGVENSNGSVTYTACPQYNETYNADGTPKYEKEINCDVHPSIYGGFLYAKTYGGTTTTEGTEGTDGDKTDGDKTDGDKTE